MELYKKSDVDLVDKNIDKIVFDYLDVNLSYYSSSNECTDSSSSDSVDHTGDKDFDYEICDDVVTKINYNLESPQEKNIHILDKNYYKRD